MPGRCQTTCRSPQLARGLGCPTGCAENVTRAWRKAEVSRGCQLDLLGTLCRRS
jgi:hypothetical protein